MGTEAINVPVGQDYKVDMGQDTWSVHGNLVFTGKQSDAFKGITRAFLNQLTPDQRKEVFNNFCVHCGTNNLPCYCWNDE